MKICEWTTTTKNEKSFVPQWTRLNPTMANLLCARYSTLTLLVEVTIGVWLSQYSHVECVTINFRCAKWSPNKENHFESSAFDASLSNVGQEHTAHAICISENDACCDSVRQSHTPSVITHRYLWLSKQIKLRVTRTDAKMWQKNQTWSRPKMDFTLTLRLAHGVRCHKLVDACKGIAFSCRERKQQQQPLSRTIWTLINNNSCASRIQFRYVNGSFTERKSNCVYYVCAAPFIKLHMFWCDDGNVMINVGA